MDVGAGGGEDRRRVLLASVAGEPGVRMGTLARRLGWGRSIMQHHLQILCRQGRLVMVRHGEARHLFLPTTRRAERAGLVAANVLQSNPALGLLWAWLLCNSPCSQNQAVSAVPAPRSVTQQRLGRLVRLGLASVERVGRCTIYRALTPPGIEPARAGRRPMP